jgi:hypothetical protein
MDIKLFLKKYSNLIDMIEKVDPAYCDDVFYDVLTGEFFSHISKYCDMAIYYSDETPGVHAIEAVDALISKLQLSVEKFSIYNKSIHIYFGGQDNV